MLFVLNSFKIAISTIVLVIICSGVRGTGPSSVQIDDLGIIVYSATYNVDSQRPDDALNLKDWLLATDQTPDIYAIGIQELVLTKTAIATNEHTPDPDWEAKFLSSVRPKGEYVLLKSVRLVGLMLTVLVRKDFRHKIEKFSKGKVATGTLNVLGNKGGVGISVRINGAHLCFINSHLAAHVDETAQRKEDFDAIESQMKFKYNGSEDFLFMGDQEYIIWCGDLNYRLHSIESREEFRALISRRSAVFPVAQYKSTTNYAEIVGNHDQLTREMNSWNISERPFNGYSEGAITFPPTYKYDKYTNEWDSSKKQRMPAWCDRILWNGDNIIQLDYNSVMSLRTSDHRPVYAVFRIMIKAKHPDNISITSIKKEKKWRRIKNRMSKIKHRHNKGVHSRRRWKKLKKRMSKEKHADNRGVHSAGKKWSRKNKRV